MVTKPKYFRRLIWLLPPCLAIWTCSAGPFTETASFSTWSDDGSAIACIVEKYKWVTYIGGNKSEKPRTSLYLFDSLGNPTDTIWTGRQHSHGPLYFMKKSGYILWGLVDEENNLSVNFEKIDLNDRSRRRIASATLSKPKVLLPSPNGDLILIVDGDLWRSDTVVYSFSFIDAEDFSAVGNSFRITGGRPSHSPWPKWRDDSTVEIGFREKFKKTETPHNYFCFGPYSELWSADSIPVCNYPATSSSHYHPSKGYVRYDEAKHAMVLEEMGGIRLPVFEEYDAPSLSICKN